MLFKLLLAAVLSILPVFGEDGFKKYENVGNSAYCGRGTQTTNGTSTEVPGVFCGDGSFAHYWKCTEKDECEWVINTWVYISGSVLLCSCIISCCLFCCCKR